MPEPTESGLQKFDDKREKIIYSVIEELTRTQLRLAENQRELMRFADEVSNAPTVPMASGFTASTQISGGDTQRFNIIGEATPDFLTQSIGPFTSALSELQNVVDDIRVHPHSRAEIVAISMSPMQRLPASAFLESISGISGIRVGGSVLASSADLGDLGQHESVYHVGDTQPQLGKAKDTPDALQRQTRTKGHRGTGK